MGDSDTVLKTFDLERGHFSSSTNTFFQHSAVENQMPSIFLIDLDSTNFKPLTLQKYLFIHISLGGF